MTRPDFWEERYLALVPEKLTAADAKELLELIRQNPEGFVTALETYIHASEDGEEATAAT